MVRVRLSRSGGKKRPYYHIVVVDQKAKRDGKCIERIGSYDPNLESEKRITLKKDRLDHWVNQGAQLSDRVKLLHKYSLDPDNLKKRQKIKEATLEKNRINKQKAKDTASEETKADAVKGVMDTQFMDGRIERVVNSTGKKYILKEGLTGEALVQEVTRNLADSGKQLGE